MDHYDFAISRDWDTNRIDAVQILSPHDLTFEVWGDAHSTLEIGIPGDEQRKRLSHTLMNIALALMDQKDDNQS